MLYIKTVIKTNRCIFLLLYSHERIKFRPLDGWRDRGFCQCFWFWTSHFFNDKLRALGCSYSRSKNECHVVVCTHSYVTITHRYTLLFAPLHVPGRGPLAVLKTLTARLISYARQLCLSSAGSAPITPLQLSFIHLNQETTPCWHRVPQTTCLSSLSFKIRLQILF